MNIADYVASIPYSSGPDASPPILTNDPLLEKKKSRVFYSRFTENRVPKNTLYTIAENGLYFFGIARCRLAEDDCEKTLGRRWSLMRAVEAYRRYKDLNPEHFGIIVNKDLNLGACRPDMSHDVLKFFFSLDAEIDQEVRQDEDTNYVIKWSPSLDVPS